MDKRKSEIEQSLKANLDVNFLDVKNKSALHAGHAGDDGTGQTHYAIEVSSPDFEKKSRIECHRMVNDALNTLFRQGLHAAEIKIKR